MSAANIAAMQGDFHGAQALLEQAVEVARGAADAWSLAMTLVPLGDLERSRGQHLRAGELYQECLSRFGEIGLADHPGEHPYLPHNLGYVALADGQPAHAGQLFLDAVSAYRRAGDTRGLAECLIGLGATAAAEGRAETAVTLFAAGEARLAAIGLELWHSNQADYQRWRALLAPRWSLRRSRPPGRLARRFRLKVPSLWRHGHLMLMLMLTRAGEIRASGLPMPEAPRLRSPRASWRSRG